MVYSLDDIFGSQIGSSLANQTLCVPQHRSLSVLIHVPHTESDRRCGTERAWLARLGWKSLINDLIDAES